MTDRMTKLAALIERDPNDPFLLFAMAMEYKKLSQAQQALDWFKKTLERDPGYCAAYHQAALTHEAAGDIASAKRTYQEGIVVARRKGDAHAAAEMEEALALLA